jgi:hypothetical protein
MKNFAKLLQLVAVLFFVGSLAVSGAAFLVTLLTASHVGGEVPMIYYGKLNLQWLTILVPALGIVAFLIALPSMLSKREATEKSNVFTFPTKSSVGENRQDHHLKAA